VSARERHHTDCWNCLVGSRPANFLSDGLEPHFFVGGDVWVWPWFAPVTAVVPETEVYTLNWTMLVRAGIDDRLQI
jgi:hypothetical protein